jgi:hypothetical protein
MCFFTVAIGFNQASLRLRYGSVLLTTWLHACVNAQGRGIFPIIFVVANPVFGGITGIIGVGVIGLIGVILLARTPEPQRSSRDLETDGEGRGEAGLFIE